MDFIKLQPEGNQNLPGIMVGGEMRCTGIEGLGASTRRPQGGFLSYRGSPQGGEAVLCRKGDLWASARGSVPSRLRLGYDEPFTAEARMAEARMARIGALWHAEVER